MDRTDTSARIFRFGLFEADAARNALTRNGVRVKIQDQPFSVLLILLERPGEIVTREELRHKLWPEGTYVDFDGSLNVILKKLRSAIDDDPDNPRFIETMPRRGYRFIAPVSTASAKVVGAIPGDGPVQTAPEVRVDAGVSPTIARAKHTGAVERYAAPVLAVLIVIAGATWFAWRWKRSDVKAPGPPSEANLTPVPLRKSVAVLGFRNVSGKVDDAWLATAFSEMLSTELAGGEALRLVSGEDVANLRHSSPWSQTDTLDQETTARVGTALNSDFLVLGSYSIIGKSGKGQLRLDVRLQDAKTGEILTEVAEIGGAQDVFHVVTRVGGRLRDRLGMPRLGEPGEASVLASLPSNPEAAQLYSLGLVKLREFDYQAARGLFAQAIAAEPKFPLAHSMLSRADIFLGHDEQAKAEAKRGLDLSSGLSRVQRMEIEASYHHAMTDRARAAEIYKVLFELFPDSLDYGLQLAKLQLESYQPDAALETIRQLRRLPPPARDDPSLDLREAGIVLPKDAEAADRLYRVAVTKALAQGKKLVYARAEQILCWSNRQHLQAPPECREAYEVFLAAGNRDDAGSCLQLMAEANRQTGHNQEAIPLYEQALGLFKEAGDREKIGVTQNNLALILENQGQWSRAERSFRDAKQNFQAVNDKANSAEAMNNIADVLTLRGRLREAADLYRQAWELIDSSGRGRHEYAHIQHGALLLIRGKIQEARPEIETQINSLRAYKGDPWQLANALTVLGDIEKAQGDLESARKNYQEALQIIKDANSPVAAAQVSLANLSVAEGHADSAVPLIRQAIAEFEKEQNAGDEINGYTSLSRALLAEGKPTEARDAIAHAFRLSDLYDFPTLALSLQLVHARAAAAGAKLGIAGRSDLIVASQEMQSVIQKSQQLGLYNIECEARLALGKLQLQINPAIGRSQLVTLASESRSRGLELFTRQAEEALGAAAAGAAAGKSSP
jgi:DNA-binding winged helix-turn-helix (wHTH) protein/Tfp pilus assembly protein PilF/TolB-like protein